MHSSAHIENKWTRIGWECKCGQYVSLEILLHLLTGYIGGHYVSVDIMYSRISLLWYQTDRLFYH